MVSQSLLLYAVNDPASDRERQRRSTVGARLVAGLRLWF
jgi:hypothetical protein